MIGSKALRRVRKYLVKKVEAERHYLTNEELVFEFSLTNFLFIKEIHAEFWNKESCQPINTELTEKDRLKINIPFTLLELIETSSKIKVFINNKQVWLTEHSSYREGDFNESLLINERYLTTLVNKTLQISNRYSDFRFSDQPIVTAVMAVEYNSLQLSLEHSDYDTNPSVEFYAFKNRKFIVLEGEKDLTTGLVRITDFFDLGMGIWRLFVQFNDTLYPLKVSGIGIKTFDSLRHHIRIIRRANFLYLEVLPNVLRPDNIFIENTENGYFNITISLPAIAQLPDAFYALLMDDPKSGIQKTYPFEKEESLLKTIVPLDEFFSTLFPKRFFIFQQSEEPKVMQFLLDSQQLNRTTLRFKVIMDSQYVKLRFYKRKDKSLGLMLSRPQLRKVITDIDGFRLDGIIGSIDDFIDSTAYLLIEDRLSLESRKVSIHDRFTIELEELNLIGLKSKDKTIFDFFVVIETDTGDVLLKEKIKYRKANYKKDNFYSYKIFKDDLNTDHHFMITTTPYNNLKIETFTIPAHINNPANVAIKDPKVWLIGERSNTAQDNGIVLFHWLLENTDLDVYYVIEEDSLDYLPIKYMKNVLLFGSPEHFEVAFRAGVLLCTHDIENILPYKPARGFFGYENTKKIFLQHGVLGRKNVEYHRRNYELPFDLFIVSSEPEKHAVVMDEMGYLDQEVAVTGLARFDRLVQNQKPHDILLMPTWRDWINTDDAFTASEYYLMYSHFIQNKQLLSLLDQYDINLNFYPHYRAQNYFQRGIKNMHERIKFIPLGSVTVQRLLIEHALLITDYSTVSFDFTLLDKPVIYYHFDADRFFRNGILRPIDETFIGGIANQEAELINLIEDRILHDFANFDIDISGIIKYQDQDNCRRIYESVQGLLEGKQVVVDGELS